MPPSTHSRSQALSEVLLWIARILVYLLLIAAPWPYGMAEWSAQVWLIPILGTIILLASAVGLWQRIPVSNPLVWSLAAVLLVALLQTIPLPQPLWAALSPAADFESQVEQLASEFRQSETSETRRATDMLPGPTTISIHPLQTRTTACVLALALGMLISASILFRDKLSISLLLATIAVSGFAIALLGIYQAIVAGDWTLLEVPKTSSFGTFYSRNSAPQFLACSFAATGGLLIMYRSQKIKRHRDLRYQISYPSVNLVARLRRRIDEFVMDVDLFSVTCLLVMAIQVIGILTANSRGGILAFAFAGVATTLAYALGKQASASATLGVLLLILCSGLFLSSFELDEIIGQRLSTVNEEAYRWNNERLELWKMALSQPSAWLLGSGLGTFHFAILPAYEAPQSTWFYHAENILVELMSNAGPLALLAALAGSLWLLWQLLAHSSKSTAGRALRYASLFSVLAICLQNLVDFSLILPAIFLPLACLSGAFLGVRHANVGERKTKRKTKRRSSKRSGHRAPQYAAGGSPSRPDVDRSLNRIAHEPARHVRSSSKREAELEDEISAPTAPGESRTSHAPLSFCVVLILISVGWGQHPLRGFAFSDSLHRPFFAKELPSDDPQEELNLVRERLQSIEQSPWVNFPETRLQAGRLRQILASTLLKSSPNWPEDLTDSMRAALSSPEFFTTVFHETSDEEFLRLREFLEQQTDALRELRASQVEMKSAIAACRLDWRASWGLMRADLNDLSDMERRRNYARILLTCRNNQLVLQAAGTHALMIGETEPGMRIWRELLPVSVKARLKIIHFLERFLTIEQLVEILPEDTMVRIELAQHFQNARQAPAAQKILETVDIEQAFGEANLAYNWQLVAWAASMKQDVDNEIAAWKEAALDDPMNHRINYARAQALQRAGQTDEAIMEIERALSRSPSNPTYQQFLNDITSQTTSEGSK